MARKKKGQKKDDQAGGDASDGHPATPGPSSAPQGPGGDNPHAQQKTAGVGSQPQGKQDEGDWQQQQSRKQQQKATLGEVPQQQQGQGQQQQKVAPSGTPQQQGQWQKGAPQQQQGRGQQQQKVSPEGVSQHQQGSWQKGSPQQQQGRGQQQQQGWGQQQQKVSPEGASQHQQGSWQKGAPQQQGRGQPQQQSRGKQQQRASPGEAQQQGRGQQQQRASPGGAPQQQQGRGQQQQRASPGEAPQQQQRASPGEAPQQQQVAWQRGAPQQQQGAWQGGAPQQQQSAWQGGAPQQQQGAWQGGAPQQQQGAWQGGAPQQQQGAWQGGATQQQQGAWQGGAPQQGQGRGQQQGQGRGQQGRGQAPQQQQRTPPGLAPQQQVQGQWQQRGQQQQKVLPQQQSQGQGQARGRQQQPLETPRTSPQDRRPQQQQAQSVVPYESELQAKMQKLSVQGLGGTQGRKIQVETNYIGMDFGKLPMAYHYDVQITPDTPKRWLRKVFELFRSKHFPRNHPAFDGKRNMYSPVELMSRTDVINDEIQLAVPNESKTKDYNVSVKFASEVDLSPLRNMRTNSAQQAMQCVEIVLRNAPSMKCIQAGRSFYTQPPRVIDLGEGMEMYYGFYQTVVRGWKPFFNVDVAHKAFPKKMNVVDLIAELSSDWRTTVTRDNLKGREIDPRVSEKLSKHLKTLRISYEISGIKREYRVNGLGKPPRNNMFSPDGKEQMSVEEYFLKKKNCRLEYPLLPTLWVGSPTRKDKILLPAELCTVIEKQVINRKMTENQTSAMIKFAATSTQVRKDKIMTSLSNTRHNDDACIREFGFRINNDFERVEARVLQPPALEYGNGVSCTPSKGVWRADNNKFYKGASMANWIIISTAGNLSRECSNLANMISSQGARSGMNLSSSPGPFDFVQNRFAQLRDVLAILQKYHNKYDIIFVIIPDSGPIYSHVKKTAEINLNCLTQCIKQKTLRKMNPSTVGNILLKVNSKLSGTNHCLKFKPPILKEPCMIMGADVTHPSPDSTSIPSVVAVTASHDPQALYGYNMCCRLQLPTVEIIEDLEEITKEHLLYFYKMNRGQKPYRIIFFRDGVSEGQFGEVRHTELSAIKRACKAMQDGYEPAITFIVVQKRHHTRFFPNKNDSEDRNCNVPAGTCVDTVITSPNVQDFYLVSHASIQGVAKPTKYSTLWDENDMSYDTVEQLAYYLCHLFSRCNRSVSYPAPTYYAHLGAARAKVYIENDTINFNNLKSEQKKLKNDVIRKENPMFFV